MNAKHGLSDQTVSRITAILERFTAVEKALLFGSRAKGVHRRGSDVDLALVGVGLNWRILGKIEEALDDALLPYKFSLIIYNDNTDLAVAAHIRRVGCSFYERTPLPAGSQP
jgi:predicted nucleotidyltransferase